MTGKYKNMNNLIHKITGFAVFFIALVVYIMTLQPSTSFWDSGEFIASANLLQVCHPPGAPLYLLTGRLFSMIPFAEDIGLRVNMLSAVASAATILFLYLIAVKLIFNFTPTDSNKKFTSFYTYAASAIGALSLAFGETFWNNAIESEVYGLALLLTSLVLWLALIWYEKSNEKGSEKYLLLIAYITGLSMGVHLYGVLIIIPVVMLVMFKKYLLDDKTLKESAIYFAGHGIILILIGGIIWSQIDFPRPYSPEELTDVNNKFLLFFGIATLIYVWLLRKKIILKESFYLPILIGGLIMIAVYPGIMILLKLIAAVSGANIYFSVTLIFALLGIIIYFINRTEKENQRTPNLLLKSFLLVLIGFSSYTMIIIRANQDTPINFNSPKTFTEFNSYLGRESYKEFPIFKRRWSESPQHIETYTKYSSDLDFMVNYQMDHMFNRYLLWNYVGRDSTMRDAGINLNMLYGIPFLVGLFGMFYHFRRDWKMATIMLSVFIFLGYLMTYYANFQQSQIRERDYFFVGAFLVFSIWIAIGVRGLIELTGGLINDSIKKPASIGILILGLIFIPVNMMRVNYSTHDRSENYLPWDFAYNLLQSVDQSAILFTAGDNDSFPIWYLQDVEGIRRDVRIVNLGLLDTKWYVEQLFNVPQRDAAPLKTTLSNSQIDNLSYIEWAGKEINLSITTKAAEKYNLADSLIEGNNYISWTMPPTTRMGNKTYLRPIDIIIKSIIEANLWEKPIYYSALCSEDFKLGLHNYLRLDGLAFQIVPIKYDFTGDYPVDENIMKAHLFNKPEDFSRSVKNGFKLRGLNNPDLHFDFNSRKHVEIIRTAYLALACHYIRHAKNIEEGLHILSIMEERIPRANIPFGYWQKNYYADLFYSAGEMEKFKQLAAEIEKVCLGKIEDDPYDFQREENPYQMLFVMYNKLERYDEALRLANILNALVPGNPQIEQLVKEYGELATKE